MKCSYVTLPRHLFRYIHAKIDIIVQFVTPERESQMSFRNVHFMFSRLLKWRVKKIENGFGWKQRTKNRQNQLHTVFISPSVAHSRARGRPSGRDVR